MQTIIYIRTSTTEQNPENQLKGCLSINKWGKYFLYKEMQSAYKDFEQRDKFNEIVRIIKKKEVSNFIVWDLDRIYRNRKKLVEFFQLCKIYKCAIHSYGQQWLETINDIPPPFNEIVHDLLLQVMGWIGEDESKRKSNRIRAAIRIRKDGAYSYKGNKWGRKSLSTFKKNKIVELRDQGMNFRSIANELNISIGVVHKILHQLSKDKQPSVG